MSIKTIKLALRGPALLNSPRFNKGTAFTKEERDSLGLQGRLPYAVDTLKDQVRRAWDQYNSQGTDLLKNSFLQSLKSQNWTLFYAILASNPTELYPIIYTPTEADAIAQYSHLFRRSEGLYLSPPEYDHMEAMFLDACEGRELDLIVVSDAEAILGIGDQGSGGIGISTAKAVIYTLAAGIDPAKALAVSLDVGTNNQDLLKDDLYLGYREKRLRGDEYDRFVDRFVNLVKKHQPKCLLHFEDFGVGNAQRLLQRYRHEHSIFNDDIQGTGAVTLAAINAAIHITKSKLEDQRIVIYGSGSAGLGIARQLRDAMRLTTKLSNEEAESRFWLIDKFGLIKKSLGDKIREDIDKGFIRTEKEWEEHGDSGSATGSNEQSSLLDVVKRVKPTILIGTSTHAGAFTEEVVREMAKHAERPIIFPLSNPTRLCEVKPEEANKWTDGKALIATGSPFDPVSIPGKDKKYVIAECNNALIYPGLGLGTILSQAKFMTDKMIVAGAERLGQLAPALKDPDDALLPDFGQASNANFEVALAVIDAAVEEGVAQNKNIPGKKEERRKWADSQRWLPVYAQYEYAEDGAR